MKAKHVPLPGKLWVGEYEFFVRVVPSTHPVLRDGVSADAEGITTFEDDNRGILIASNLGSMARLNTVTHEITHAINWAHDIGYDDIPIDEEMIAHKHGDGWSKFFLDNPRYVKWLVFVLAKIRAEQKAHSDAESVEPTTKGLHVNQETI